MRNLASRRTTCGFCGTLLLVAGLTSCSFSGGPGGVSGWIDSPVNGIVVLPGSEISIEAHVSTLSPVRGIQLILDDDLLAEFPGPEIAEGLIRVGQLWTADTPGQHLITLVCIALDGTSLELDHAGLTVMSEVIDIPGVVTPTPTPTVVPTSTPTPTPTAVPTITPTVTPTPVITVPPVHVPPTLTPTPVPDTTGPPAPVLISPYDGQEFLCAEANLVLDWDPVTDPSGIDDYQLVIQRRQIAGDWEKVATHSGITATKLPFLSECGWIYRWRVRAFDGAGNPGTFSAWSEFSVVIY